MDNYNKLREILHKNPIGAPQSRAFDEILRILFTPQEVDVAISMTFVPKNVDDIARSAGVSEEVAQDLCESMAQKGVVFSRKKDGQMGYALLPTVPGLFEFPFMRGGGTPFHDKLARLWEEYHKDGLASEFGASKTPVMRVIPIEQTVAMRSETLHFDLVSKMLESSQTFGLANCACRVSVGKCEKPLETCIMTDSVARFLIDRGIAREITLDEAKETLRIAEEAGLVHACTNSQDRLTVICNCCSCCCTVLRGLTELKNPNAFAPSRYLASVDPELCVSCGTCRDQRCPMSAIEITNKSASVIAARCIGCGLCASTCPESAISMVRRQSSVIPPATVEEMAVRVLKEKGRLEDYVKLNKGN